METVPTQDKKNYGGSFLVKGKFLKCYTLKQIKAFYPQGGYLVLGEYAPSERQSSQSFTASGLQLKLYRQGTFSRIIWKPRGYLASAEDSFIILLENRIIPRAAGILLCGLMVAAAIWGMLHLQSLSGPGTKPSGPDIDQNAVDRWDASSQNSVSEGSTEGIKIPGFKTMKVKAGASKVQATLQNPEGNPCYFVITLKVDGKERYKSKMIPPGKGIYEITLAEHFNKGSYSGVLLYEAYALEGLAPMNGANMNFTLVAE